MSDLVIIVTRMTQDRNDNEFQSYFDNDKWAVIYNNDNTVVEIPNQNNSSLTYNNKIIVVYVDGMKVKNSDDHRNSLCVFLNEAMNKNREILILVHPGIHLSIEKAKERIFCSTNENNRVDENKKIIFAKYSGTQNDIFTIVTNLANAISNGNNNIDNCIVAVKEYIKKSIKPHLIALSILCQGYLAAHGKEGFKISDGELQKKAVANIVITENQNWWEPALGNDFNGTKLGEELETVAEDKKTGIKCLIEIIKNKKDENEELYFDDKGKIVNDGMTQKFTGKVTEAYGNLKKSLGTAK